MNRLIHIGFGNIVNTSKKEAGTAIDATQGRKTKSVLVMENSQIVLSALLPETIAGRAQGDLGVPVREEEGHEEE